MSDVFEFTTNNSHWRFDFESMIMSRMPRAGENTFTEHQDLKYSKVGKPTPFIWVKPYVRGPFTCYRFFLGDHVRTSGDIISSTGEIPEDHLKEFADE